MITIRVSALKQTIINKCYMLGNPNVSPPVFNALVSTDDEKYAFKDLNICILNTCYFIRLQLTPNELNVIMSEIF